MNYHKPELWMIYKARRAYYYFKFVYGWKSRKCTACNGSGYYDNDGSPTCGGCDGTKTEKFRGPKSTDDAFEKYNKKLFGVYQQDIASRS